MSSIVATGGVIIEVTGARGKSEADILRATGAYGVLPTDDDLTAELKKNAVAMASAALAESASGPTYESVAAGEAATTVGNSFAVSNGDGTVTVYLRTSGGSTAQRTLATTAALASTDPANPGASKVGLPGGGTVADAIGWFAPEMLNPFAGTGGDDTLTMRQWAMTAAPIHRLGAGKTYRVRKTAGDDILIPFLTGKVIEGCGSTILVMDGAGEFYGILGAMTPGPNLTGTKISNLTIDHNGPNNPAGITNSLLNKPHCTFSCFNGDDIDFCDNVVLNARCTNSVYINGWQSGGSVQATKRARVNRNKWLNLGGGDVYYDHSTVYFHGPDIECNDNYVESVALGASGTKCFFEPHSTRINCHRNQVYDMEGFSNLTGIYSGGDTEMSMMSHNKGRLLQFGIRIFSSAYQNHSSGFGADGFEISSNLFRIHQSQLAPGTSRNYLGIGFQAGATLPSRRVWITGNIIIYDLETSPTSYTALSPALGVSETEGSVLFDTIVIDGNTVINAPDAAVALGYGGGTFKDCAITESNIFINPGQTQSSVVSAKHAIVLYGQSYLGYLEVSGKIVDNFDTTRLLGGVFANPSNNSSEADCRSVLKISLAGANKGAFGRIFRNSANQLSVRLKAEINKAANVALSDQLFKIGSEIADITTGIDYRTLEMGGGLIPVSKTPSINSTSGTSYTLVLSDYGNYRRFTNASAVTVTIPTDATVPFPIGALLELEQAGVGAVTASGASGVTVQGMAATTAQYQLLRLRKVGVDTWVARVS